MKKSIIILFLVAVIFCLSSCGSSGNGVPDGTAELVVLDYLNEYKNDLGNYKSYNFKVTHDYDSQSQLDKAVIDLEIQYYYGTVRTYIPVTYSFDRASDLWNVERKGKWSEESSTLDLKSLIGPWSFDYASGTHHEVDIQSVNGDSVTLKYLITESVQIGIGLEPNRVFTVSGSGTYSISNQSIKIPIDLPDGFCCRKGDRYGLKSTNLSIIFTCKDGCWSIGFEGIVYVE